MPSTGRDLHVDKPLSNMAIAYKPEGLIAEEIAPIIDVDKQHDSYYVFGIDEAFRVSDAKRAPGTVPNRVVRSVSSDTYFCENYALQDAIPYEDMANADAGTWVTEREARTEGLKDDLMLGHELRVGLNCTSGSNVGSSSTVSSAWSGAGADPIGDVNTGINNVQDATGYRPNRVVFGQQAWRIFREHPDVIDRIYGESGRDGKARTVTRDQVAALFEVDQVHVGAAYYNAAAEGQDAVLSQVWQDNVLTYYAPQKPRRDKPSFMYTFRWKKIAAMQARIFQNERAGAEEIHLGHYITQKITAPDLGFLITGVGSSQ